MTPLTSFSRGVMMLAVAALFELTSSGASAHGDAGQDMTDPHARHHQMMEHATMNPAPIDHAAMNHGAMDRADMSVRRSAADYVVPDVKLVREDGKAVSLRTELNDGRPVFLTFIYTACTTVCPVASQTFSQLQDALGSERSRVHLVSISIDPEQDTPSRLKDYARRFGAGPEWQHYTGTTEASIAAQRAFDVYRGDKMNHNPVTLVRAAPGQPWLRIDGFVTAKELVRDYRALAAS